MYHPNNILKIVSLLVITINTCGCWTKPAAFPSKNKGNSSTQLKTFRGPLGMNPSTLEPTHVCNEPYAKQQIFNQIFEGLVRYNAQNKIQPAIAESWSVDNNNRTYTFYIKENLFFHDNKPVYANDVKWSFERACSPNISSPTASMVFQNIIGAKQVLDGKTKNITGIETPNPKTVIIHLTKPNVFFLDLLTMPVASIVSKKSTLFDSPISKLNQMIGTGPYLMKEYIPGQQIILEPFEKYIEGKPKIKNITWHIAADPIMNMNKFREGNYSWTPVPIKEMSNVKSDPVLQKSYHVAHTALLIHLQFCSKAYKPFENPLVRKAFCMAINRNTIVDSLLKDSGIELANSFIPPIYQVDSVKNKKHETLELNISKAKKLLKQAGYSSPAMLPRLEVLLPDNSLTGITVAENICLQLKANLGINITTKQQEYTAYLQSRSQNLTALHLHGTYAQYIDPSVYLSEFDHSNSITKSLHLNPQFTELMDKASIETNLSKRIGYYQKAENLLLDTPPALPLYYSNIGYLLKYNVKNYERNMLGATPFTNIEID